MTINFARATQFLAATTNLLATAWYWLTTPARSIIEPEQRRRVHLLLTMLVSLIPVSLFSATVLPLLFDPSFNPLQQSCIGVLAAVALLAAYGLSRTQRYTRGAALTTVIANLGVWASLPNVCTPLNGCSPIYFLSVTVIISSILLPLPFTAALALTNVVGILLIPLLDSSLTLAILTVPLICNVMISLLITVTSSIQRQDLRQIEEQSRSLSESEQRYRGLFEATFEGILIHDGARIIDANAAFSLMFGADPQAVKRRSILDYLDQDSRAAMQRMLQRGDRGPLEVRGVKPDGSCFDVEVISKPYIFQGRPASVSAFRDISAHKLAEHALRESEERYRSLIAAMAEGVLLQDADGVIRAANASAERILGISVEQMRSPAQTEGAWGMIHEDGTPFPFEDHPNMVSLRTGEPQSNVIMGLHKPNGTLTWVSINAQPLQRAHEPKPYAVVASFSDITERKAAEAVIRQRADEFAALYDTTHDLAAERDLPTLLEIIVSRAMHLLHAPSAAIYLYDAQRQIVEVAITRGQFTQPLRARAPLGDDLPGQVISTRQALIVNDREQPASFAPMAGAQFHAAVAVPMLYQGEVIGVLALTNTEQSARRFSEADARLLSLFAGQAASAVHNARLFAQTDRRLKHLRALRAIDIAIASSVDMHVSLKVVLEQVLAQLGVDAADVLLLDKSDMTLSCAASIGVRAYGDKHLTMRLAESAAGRVILERQIMHFDDLANPPLHFRRSRMLADEGFVSYYGVPLVTKGEIKGVLELFHRAPLAPDAEWLQFLEALAGQAAIAVENVSLFNDLQRANIELRLAYDTTLEGWSHALDLRDRETEGHTLRVTDMTLRLARVLGLSDAQLSHVRRGALLHDIGKVGIPDSILHKPGPLSADEWDIMRRHPQYAYELLAPITYLQPALDIPYCHHEWWDGSGYPRGLKADQIPLAARLFAVVDVWDALRSDRPYRKAWPEERVREYIASLAGKQFDPKIVDEFLCMCDETP